MSTNEYRFLFFKLNIWLCLASALMVGIAAVALSVPLTAVGGGLLLPPLLFYFIYVEDRRSVSPGDEISHPHRTALVRKYEHVLLGTEIVALLGYQALLGWFVLTNPRLGPLFLVLGQLPIAVLVAYESLKRQPMFDSVAVGATWAFVTVFALVVSTGTVGFGDVGGVFAAWFVIVFAGAESRNIPDAEGDTQSNRTTLAGALGPSRASALVVGLKTVGVVAFWALAGMAAAGLAVGYLLLIRLCRTLTRQEVVRWERNPVSTREGVVRRDGERVGADG